MPPKSTEFRLLHFDDYAYTGTSDTNLYKFVDSLCGTTGAGALVNEIFLARMAGALDTIYFNELDFIFGRINFLARSSAESYVYNPMVDMLTSDQWSEVRIKDAWYRARIKDFFQACSLGGTPEGVRRVVSAALAVDCDIYEVWRYRDNFGLTGDLGRAPLPNAFQAVDITNGDSAVFDTQGNADTYVGTQAIPSHWIVNKIGVRNEVVIRPHKTTLEPAEMRLVRDMLDKVMPEDVIITVNTLGLAVMTPVAVAAATADSTYFEVQKLVTATPVLDQLPPPELLPIDLLPTETWLYQAKYTPTLAPYTAFNITQEQSYYYLTGGGSRSPIDSVTYGTLQADGSVKTEPNYQAFVTTGEFSDKKPYDKADSPDNYPGGKFGIHPSTAPAQNPDGTIYHFPYPYQAAFVEAEIVRIQDTGGIADEDGYRVLISAANRTARTFLPEYAVSFSAPAKDSDVSESVTRRRGDRSQFTPELRDPINFVRTS